MDVLSQSLLPPSQYEPVEPPTWTCSWKIAIGTILGLAIVGFLLYILIDIF